MKLIHLSDLHLGKRLNEFSLLEDQSYILDRILEVIDTEGPDGVLIAGDIYDRPVPSAEAVALLDDFLAALTARELPVLLISGNHDSPERLAFGGRVMEKSRVYLSPVYHGTVTPVTLEDAYGPVDIFLLPFVKPAHVRRFYGDEAIESYTDAVASAIAHMPVDSARRNVLVTHQFVSGAERCESEECSVGGTDNVDLRVFQGFDYVALGHLHGPQNVGDDRVRYCGTPLKYSFSEVGHTKSVTVVELGKKGERTVRTVPLTPKRDLVELRGSYDELTARSYYGTLDTDAYYRVILTDEDDIPEAMGRLRAVYPNVMELKYDNRRTRGGGTAVAAQEALRLSPMELFSAFYQQQNNSELSEPQLAYLADVMEEIWEVGE